ncbi:hypothetical protein FRC14_007468 [Serendipita sp. 396]|nr:hypothetical protein FRC14_007468 [Serendipita sp. 396]KAG8786548.1 hypothetical protein FRC15_011194 [Serendipita sp. 397]KAG8803568.1 hypothetical protein FRC16_004441 [Serendipita sp. 398]KAG8827503.1 hypothetical protein FRC19_002581 [Serendipita sp. 401]KAG8839419.1 hypothetical protein FRC18_010899 [Serendipita sp. 400]KAG8853724.1 hypothetical protein FRB91_004426 [Serendipita sp. 411]KAG8871213.1 hypothetical protein FRC20_010828 [Serendipita sp. 405]KAG9057910.1 hypothetical prot
MSTQKPSNGRPAGKDEDESDEVLLYPIRMQPHPGNYSNPAAQSNPQSQRQEPPRFHPREHPHYRSQTPVTQHYGRSPASLHQYALFPAPMRSVTPGPVATTSSNNYNTPLSNNFLLGPVTDALHTSFNCPEPQSFAPDLQASTSSSSGSSVKKHSCHLCIMSFERRYDLKRHMHTHAEQKEFECSRCRKALARNDSLQRHKAVCKGPKSP